LNIFDEIKQCNKNIVIGVPKRNPSTDPNFEQCSLLGLTNKFHSDIS